VSDNPAGAIPGRKADHIRLAATGTNESGTGPGWDDIRLVHQAIPTVDYDHVDVGAALFGRRLRLPVVVAGMTGGHPDAAAINGTLGAAAERWGIAMGVGSQRAALRDPSLAATYAVARESAPTAMLFANLGISQLLDQPSEPAVARDDLRRAVEMIRADAFAIHLNFLEELVQLEGQVGSAGVGDAIARAVQALDMPVMVKETGSGISRVVAERARAAGAAAVDVGGLGGTSFAAIEGARAREAGNEAKARLGETFGGWGIPTAVCVAGCAGVLPVIATGGVRTGLDAAKAMALGATAVGIGRPLLQAAMNGASAVDEWLHSFERELRAATFLSGCASVAELRRAPRVIEGQTARWLDQLGYPSRPG
jgi:isopentenyl-diphosphate delta-isomerase